MPSRDSFVILGAEELPFALADCLREGGRPVLFVDSNPTHCRAAEESDYQVVYGNALAFATLARARLELARAVLGITPNDEVNSLFAREAADDFSVENTYVARSRDQSSVRERILEKQGSRALFDGPTDIDRWNVRFRHALAEVTKVHSAGVPEDTDPGAGGPADGYVLLTRWRGDNVDPMYAGFSPREGDRADVALLASDRKHALAKLRASGWILEEEGETSAV